MNVIESKWRERKSRVEEGIFFGNDEFVALRGSPDGGYTASKRNSVAALLQMQLDQWCWLSQGDSCAACHGDLSILGGATSWEAEGFVAVEANSRLLWILHLSESEEFVEISTDGTIIVARSGGYPDCFEWRIPIVAPETLTVARVPRTSRAA